eukprot:COSAG05_NODE_3755_length_1855_cov_7.467758_1_plen_179_part_00
MLYFVQFEIALTNKLLDTSRGAHNAVRSVVLEYFFVLFDRHPAVENCRFKLSTPAQQADKRVRTAHLGAPAKCVKPAGNIDSLVSHVGHVLAEAVILVLDLERKLTGMAETKHKNVAAGRQVQLLQSGKYENSSLSHAGFRLAYHIHAQDRLRDAFMLNYVSTNKAGEYQGKISASCT